MGNYGINLSVEPTIHGKIKAVPEDFIVEEVTPEGKACSIRYGFFQKLKDKLVKGKSQQIHMTLVKYNYTTQRAMAALNHRLRISKSRIGYAGTKDKKAVTAQRISIWNIKLDDVKKIKLTDILLKEFELSDKRLTLGDLSGNNFTITIRGEFNKETREKLKKFSEKLKSGLPNFFGPQRFGLQRPVNHLVGKQLLLGNFEGVVMILLTAAGNENEDAKKAREFAANNWGNWSEILKIWPPTLGVEAAILNYLVKYPKDFANAFRKLQKNLRRMFVHAVQSYIFNESLSEYLSKGIEIDELPLVGYDIALDEVTAGILKKENIEPEMFRLKRMPELSESGEMRTTKIFPKNFKVVALKNDKAILSFFLGKGSYATVLLYYLTGDWGE